jgi:hypothetical protein
MKPLQMHIKARTKSQLEIEKSADNTNVEQEVAKSTVWAFGVAPVLIGLWAAACIVGALLASDGPLALVQKWMSAILGS